MVKKIDARVVSLESFELNNQANSQGAGMPMFAYYDAMQIKAVSDFDDMSPLLKVYTSAMEMFQSKEENLSLSARPPYRQLMFAFTDVTDSATDEFGYTAEEIKSFWENDRHGSFLFCTMVHITHEAELKDVLKKVKNHFSDFHALTYLGFDHCDFLLFCRSNSFTAYTQKILEMDYTYQENHHSLFVDSITLFSIADPNYAKASQESEVLSTHIRLGVSDYTGVMCELKKWESSHSSYSFQKFWEMGRSDIGLWAIDISLQDFTDILLDMFPKLSGKREGAFLCTTIEVTVDMRIPSKDIIMGSTANNPVDADTQKHLMEIFEDYINMYTDFCTSLPQPYKEDLTWIRWLNEITNRAMSFFNNKMTYNLGVCLVSQLFDFFNYMRRLLPKLKRDEHQVEYVKKLGDAHFSFFSNILILFESMDHSNRQFIQTPSFRIATFEMPSRIIAFLTAVTDCLRTCLQEDQDISYGFTISPRFVNNGLQVRSLALEEVLSKHQLLSLGVGEESLYSLRKTVTMLAHELSHFVGEESRCRNERAEYMIKSWLSWYILNLCAKIQDKIGERCQEVSFSFTFTLEDIEECVEALSHILYDFDEAQINIDEYIPRPYYGRDVESFLQELPSLIYNNSKLTGKVMEKVNWLVKKGTISPPADSQQSTQIDPHSTIMKPLEKVVRDLFGIRSVDPGSSDMDFFTLVTDPLIVEEIQMAKASSWQTIVKNGNDNVWKLRLGKHGQIRSLFQETFADLQAILLLRLRWEEYYEEAVLISESDQEQFMRMLSVAYVCEDTDFESMIICNSETETGKSIKVAKGLFHSIAMRDVESLNEFVDPYILYALIDYLRKCRKKTQIEQERMPNSQKKALNGFRDMYSHLQDNVSTLDMETSIRNFIRTFANQLHFQICTENELSIKS